MFVLQYVRNPISTVKYSAYHAKASMSFCIFLLNRLFI